MRPFPPKQQLFVIAGISALISAAVAWNYSAQKNPFHFEVEFRSSQPAMAQLFYDVGKGINQPDSVWLQARADKSMTLRFPIPPGQYRGFRFDPTNHGECRVVMRHPRVVDILGRTLLEVAPEQFEAFHATSEKQIVDGELRLYFAATDDDPYFAVNLASPLTLRPSPLSFWLLTLRTFCFCFIPLCGAGIGWLLFAPPRWTATLPLFALLLIFVFLLTRSRFLARFSFDEEAFIWYGSLVNNGSIPYRDFAEPKPPVIFFANALGLALFGLKGFLFRIVPATVAVSSVLFFLIALIKRRVAPWLGILLTAQIALWLLGSDFHDESFNDSETYGFAFTALGLSLGCLAAGRRKTVLYVLSGICFALAVLSKEFFVFSVVPAWLLAARGPEDRSLDRRQLFFSAAGGIAIGLIFLAYLLAHSAFGSYIAVLRFSKTFAANYCIDIGRFPNVTGLAAVIASWNKLHLQLYDFGHLAFVLPLWTAAVLLTLLKVKEKSRLADFAIAVVALVLSMIGVSVGHCFGNITFWWAPRGCYL